MDYLVTPEEKTEENSMYRRMLRVPRITSKYDVYEKKVNMTLIITARKRQLNFLGHAERTRAYKIEKT